MCSHQIQQISGTGYCYLIWLPQDLAGTRPGNFLNLEWLSHCGVIQGAAEIVKHFKILVTCLSARVSWSAGICT